jgi:hypothetical protein
MVPIVSVLSFLNLNLILVVLVVSSQQLGTTGAPVADFFFS